MEQNNGAAKGLTEKILLAAALFITGAALVAHINSPVSQALSRRQPVDIVFFTKPPALLTYRPQQRMATITFVRTAGKMQSSLATQAAQIQQVAASSSTAVLPPLLYIDMPEASAERHLAWSAAKDWLLSWHENPLKIKDYLAAYAAQKDRGNISAYDFALLSLELSQLGLNDFSISDNEDKQTTPEAAETEAKPLIIEVLNASSKKGMALAATTYLRTLREQNVLNIDVLSYDNYKQREPKSRILDHTGRLGEIAEMARQLGLTTTEITSDKRKINYADVTIIVGDDLVIPENLTDPKKKEMLN